MKGISARIAKGLKAGSFINCADNTGAKILQIISVFDYKGVKRRQPICGVADVIKVTVKEGDVKMRHQVLNAIIVRQRLEYRRKEGIRVKFEDNAAIIVDDNNEPTGTEVKGPIAKEVLERFTSVGKVASIVV